MPVSNSRIMIVAGEASGDLHAASLVRELKNLAPRMSFCGMGGAGLEREGVELLNDISEVAVVGLFEVASHLKAIRTAMRRLEKRLRERPPHLLILIDYPDFNLILARKAKRLGVPVFYYISPQVWAWRSGRVKKIARLVKRIAVILPFEKQFYQQRGVRVDFVGHPLLDSVRLSGPREAFLKRHGIPPDARLIGILPGSRRKEVSALLPVFLEAARLLARRFDRPIFLLPLAPSLSAADLENHGLAGCGLDIRVIAGEPYDLMSACEAVMTASGTVTLELAILGVPMVVVYRVSRLTYLLGRSFIKVEFVSLVNLVAGTGVVPELLQQNATPEKISAAVYGLLENAGQRTVILRQLAEVRKRLGEPGASLKTARLVLELLRSETTPSLENVQ